MTALKLYNGKRPLGAHLLLQVRCAVLNGELLLRFQAVGTAGTTLPSRDSGTRYRVLGRKGRPSRARLSLISSQPGAVAAGQARARSSSSRASHLLWGLGNGAEPIFMSVTNAAPSTFM